MTTSLNGWPAAHSLPLTNRTIPGTTAKVPPGILRGSPAVVLEYVASFFNHHVEKLRDGECWGFHFRKSKGGSGYSNHASGTAIDLNAPSHPYKVADTFTKEAAQVIRGMLRDLGGAVRWGGDYRTTKDEMHFEIDTTKQVLDRVAPLVSLLFRKRDVPRDELPTVDDDSPSVLVRIAQRALQRNGFRVHDDGHFGPKTLAAVVEFQKARRLGQDGVVGPLTWQALA